MSKLNDSGLHGSDHEKYKWFSYPLPDFATPDKIAELRHAYYLTYECVLYNSLTFETLGYILPNADLDEISGMFQVPIIALLTPTRGIQPLEEL